MKHFFLIFALGAISWSLPTFGQNAERRFFSIGLRASLNASWIGELPASTQDLQNISREDLKIGYVGGIYTQLRLPLGGLYLQPEVAISQVGGKYRYSAIVPNLAGIDNVYENFKTLSLTNLDFPLLIGYRFALGPIGLNLNLGGVFSAVLSAKETYEQEGFQGLVNLGRIEAERNIKDQINNFQAALQGGIGLDFSRFLVNISIQQNLTEVFESQTANLNLTPSELALVLDRETQRLLTAQITLGFRLY
ncbi:MAG: PorT family protein [Microscillaceae bacterium]|nr:PorT family protein [Microscillaceae bacterium]